MKLKLPSFGRYFTIGLIVTATVGIAVAGYVAQGYQYNHLFDLYQKQNAQLRENGIEPETPSPETVAQSGPVGATGAAGPQGDRGPGPTDAQIFTAVSDYCSTPQVPCKGETGTPGATGAPGASVTGPAGANGDSITGPQGPKGDPGESITGPPGTNGTDGQPPLSWTYTDMLGIAHTCTRADPFDAAAPTYTCN